MKEVIIVGWINKGKPADCGETMKNQLIIQKLEGMGIKCYQEDFKGWRLHPWIILQLVWDLVVHKNSTLILSTSPKNIYLFMKVLKKIHWRQNTVHWVIGGNFGNEVEQGKFDADVVRYMRHTLVESHFMVEQLEGFGIKGVKEVPNFKPITHYPGLRKKYPESEMGLRFVFLSRIMPEKGCDYILEAAKLLNAEGYEERYIIDFYGKEEDTYKTRFKQTIDELKNVHYKGFLNLRVDEGYDTLSNYDMMLFPTYWEGEGFAGIFIDAFVCGLPIIATDWAHNTAFLTEGETALFVPVHDVTALHKKMKECIEGYYDINEMAYNCQNQAERYNVDNVITKELLEEIGVL